jgi:hypothetical protein
VFSKIKVIGDEVGDSSKLTDSGMLFTEAKLFWKQDASLMKKIIQSVGYSSL